MDNKTSFTDIPRTAAERDRIGIEPFEEGIVRFLRGASTPITIALQGEWGSGKTSLMNSLNEHLCEGEGAPYMPIWVNTWEYGLMSNASNTLIEIIGKLITGCGALAQINSNSMLKKVANLGQGVIRVALNHVADGVGDAALEALQGENKGSSIGELRKDLQNVINTACERKKKSGFIFFIDDLDRMNPAVAVELLELLKNIFTLERCIFVLAIDYDVVIKGLKPKFGELNEQNEREFRSFFDKIIQVPFSMPITSYRIEDLLMQQLTEIGYLSLVEKQNPKLKSLLSQAVQQTIGTNPRALKRLLNTLSLITCINSAKSSKLGDILLGETDKYLNFVLVCLQVAYPRIYQLLTDRPHFDRWGEQEALQYNLPQLSDSAKARLAGGEEFDEEWEQFLFRFCEQDVYLKQRAHLISLLINTLRKEIDKEARSGNEGEESVSTALEADYGNKISSIIRISSVTSIAPKDSPEIDFHAPTLLKQVRSKLIAQLRKHLPELKETIEPATTRVQINAPISIGDNKLAINLISRQHSGRILLALENTDVACMLRYRPEGNYESFDDFVAKNGKEAFSAIAEDYNKLAQHLRKYDCYRVAPLEKSYFCVRERVHWNLKLEVLLSDEQDFWADEIGAHIVEMALMIYRTSVKLKDFAQIYLSRMPEEEEESEEEEPDPSIESLQRNFPME